MTGDEPIIPGQYGVTMTLDVHSGILMSANRRIHWGDRARRTRALRHLAWAAWVNAGRPVMGRAHLTVTVLWPDRRHRDAHNLTSFTLKACVDGMVSGRHGKTAGILPDDSDEVLVGPDVRVSAELSGRAGWTRLVFDWEEIP